MRKINKIEVAIPKIIPKKRVAAYARVSKDTEVLLHSFSAQISYYSALIQKNPEWYYMGVYADEGITGTSTEKRDDFKRLVADCDAGKIDIVLTKSISRFARNTVDLLETVRHLKDIGVEVRFEREHISSFSGDGELMLTILASFAQEESQSMSENIKWAIKKGYAKGEPHTASRAYGYEWNGDKYVIVPEEAEVVIFIFEQYLDGVSSIQIPKLLNKKEIKGLTGGTFTRATIKDMLANEIYIGNLVLQKTYSAGIRKRVRNYGEMPKYRVEEAHEPIIYRELFDAVQVARMERGENASNKDAEITCFSGMVKCGCCGCSCSRRNVIHSKTTNRIYYKRWVCNGSETKRREFCKLRPIFEDDLRIAASIVLGMEYKSTLQKKVDEILLFDDRVKFRMKDGKIKVWNRDFLTTNNKKTCFSGKVFCGYCGCTCIRGTLKHTKAITRTYYNRWICIQRRNSMSFCNMDPIVEDELRKATMSIIGDSPDYELRFYCEVDKVVVFDDKAEFYMKNGEVKVWQRE